MAKPTVANSRWDTDGTNMTAPGAGQRNTGIAASAAAVSSYINYLFNQMYLWFVFLDPLFSSAGAYTAPVNESVTISGTGRYKHPAWYHWIAGSAFLPLDNTVAYTRGGTVLLHTTAALKAYEAPIYLQPGKTVSGVVARVITSGNAGTRRLFLYRGTGDGLDSEIGTVTSGTTSTTVSLTLASGLPHVLLDTGPYVATVVLQQDDILIDVKVTYADA